MGLWASVGLFISFGAQDRGESIVVALAAEGQNDDESTNALLSEDGRSLTLLAYTINRLCCYCHFPAYFDAYFLPGKMPPPLFSPPEKKSRETYFDEV